MNLKEECIAAVLISILLQVRYMKKWYALKFLKKAFDDFLAAAQVVLWVVETTALVAHMTSGHSSCRFIKASFCQKSYQLLVTRLWPRGCLLVSSAFLMSPLLLLSHSVQQTGSVLLLLSHSAPGTGSVLPKCHPTTTLAQSLITGFSLATLGQIFSCHLTFVNLRER